MENNYSAKWKKRGTRQGLLRNALLKTMGYTDEDIEKPLIPSLPVENLKIAFLPKPVCVFRLRAS